MSKFHEFLAQDVKNTFHNTQEFAEIKKIRYDRKEYEIPIIIDHSIEDERKKSTNDFAEGIFVVDLKVYISMDDFPVKPRKNHNIEIEDELFNIIKVEEQMGEYVLSLELLDE